MITFDIESSKDEMLNCDCNYGPSLTGTQFMRLSVFRLAVSVSVVIEVLLKHEAGTLPQLHGMMKLYQLNKPFSKIVTCCI